MRHDRLSDVRAGQRLRAEHHNRMAAAVRAVAGVSGPDLVIDGAGAHARLRHGPRPHAVIVARISGSPVDQAYPWVEQHMNAEGEWVDKTAGRSGTATEDPAIELNGRTDVAVDERVLLHALRGADGARRWFFAAVPSGTADSPATLGAGAEHYGAADATTWDRDSQGANDGVEVWQVTRMGYDHTSTHIMYAYLRKFTYDSAGMLKAISAETRVTIDEAESYTT